MKFEEFNIDDELLRGLNDAGYTECMPVQEQTLRLTLEGKDVEVQSQTGTGKTAAFLITVFQLFQKNRENRRKTLIVVPTRELAVQIEQEAKLLSKYIDINIVSIFGGTGYKKQEALIEQGADVIIGTPGRLIDFGKSGKIKFREIGTLIIDEADRMFDMGFIPDLRWMMRKMPAREQRNTMLFSATLNSRVRQLAWEYMNEPEEIEIAPESITVEEIEQVLYHVSKEEKLKLLLGILNKDKPETAVIFINTKQHAVELSKRLNHNGLKSSYLMGDMPQKKRLSIINRVKSGEIKLLVATDVAARGLHINDLEMVFNYDLPEDCENYVHRIGRTARAGKTGKAVSLACEKYVFALPSIEEYIKMKIPVEWADEELYAEDLSEGIRFRHERRSSSGRTDSRRTSGRSRRGSNTQHSSGYGNSRRTDSGRKNTERQNYRKESPVSDSSYTDSRKTASSSRSGRMVKSGRNENRNDSRRKGFSENQKNRGNYGNRKRNENNSLSRKNNRSYEDRIKYYNEKYGENIAVSDKNVSENDSRKKSGKKSILKRIFGLK